MNNYRSTIIKQERLSPESPVNLRYSNMLNFPIHWHDCIEIIYILEGELIVYVNDIKYYMEMGEVLLINSTDLHSFESVPGKQNLILMIQVEIDFFSRIIVDKSIRKTPLQIFDKLKHIKKDNNQYDSITIHLNHIVKEFDKKQQSYILSVFASLIEIYLIYIRIPDEGDSSIIPGKILNSLRDVLDYVSNHFSEAITLETIAKVAAYSPFHFSRIFKKHTGQTFFNYLKQYRIYYATDLLLSTDMTITQIAFLCGFNNLKTFNRQFHEIEHTSPSIYRKTHK